MGVCLFLLASSAALAESAFPSNSILEGCRTVSRGVAGRGEVNNMQWGACAGILHTLMVTSSHLQTNMRSCVPGEATIQQAAKVLVKYLDDRPETLHEPAVIAVIESFRAAWPCKTK
jgi:hypothetical protein